MNMAKIEVKGTSITVVSGGVILPAWFILLLAQ